MKKRGFFYLKNTLILSVLLFLFISISPVFASQLNQTLTYDGNGNLITGDGKYREYNEFNQLLRVYDGSYSNGTILESYFYHPTENRILIKYGGYSSTTPDEAVVYVNDNLEKAYDGIRGTLSVNYTYYTFDENGLVGEIVKNNINTTLRTLYYHDDYSGSVSLITNGSGWVVEQTFYDPYGAILGGGNVSRYSYEGKEFSSVTDDFDFHFRKYDPSLMIFTQPDSIIANVYDPQSLNRYSFERNNPYRYVDKDGKSFTLIALFLTGVFIANFVLGIIHSSNDNSVKDYAEFTGEEMYNSFGTDEGVVMTAGGIGASGELESIFKSGKNVEGQIQGIADELGSTDSAVGGTLKHSQAENILNNKGLNNIYTETSIKNGEVVSHGTSGSVRLDVLHTNQDLSAVGTKVESSNIFKIYDYKFGSSSISSSQASKIIKATGVSSNKIKAIHPQTSSKGFSSIIKNFFKRSNI